MGRAPGRLFRAEMRSAVRGAEACYMLSRQQINLEEEMRERRPGGGKGKRKYGNGNGDDN